MRFIGLDLGSKTVGVALSDKSGKIASKYGTLNFESENYVDALNKLTPILLKYNITNIVLGYPKNMNNTIGPAAQRSLDFKKFVEDELEMNVYLQDERLSSVEANNILIKGDVSRKKRKKNVDTIAAVIILQNFLDSRKVEDDEE